MWLLLEKPKTASSIERMGVMIKQASTPASTDGLTVIAIAVMPPSKSAAPIN
jgi:hypothetical protein